MSNSASSSKSSNRTVNEDNDAIADNGALALAEGATLDQMTGGAVGVADNVITGDGTRINHGVQFGDGTIYNVTGLDEQSYNLIDTAMTLQHLNTENFMELTAEREGIDSAKITPMNPLPGARDNPLTISKRWIVGIVFVVIVTIAVLIRRKKKS